MPTVTLDKGNADTSGKVVAAVVSGTPVVSVEYAPPKDAKPLVPLAPAGPCGPIGPVGPMGPTAPVAQANPLGPRGPRSMI